MFEGSTSAAFAPEALPSPELKPNPPLNFETHNEKTSLGLAHLTERCEDDLPAVRRQEPKSIGTADETIECETLVLAVIHAMDGMPTRDDVTPQTQRARSPSFPDRASHHPVSRTQPKLDRALGCQPAIRKNKKSNLSIARRHVTSVTSPRGGKLEAWEMGSEMRSTIGKEFAERNLKFPYRDRRVQSRQHLLDLLNMCP